MTFESDFYRDSFGAAFYKRDTSQSFHITVLEYNSLFQWMHLIKILAIVEHFRT